MSTGKWAQEGVPHQGWTCVGCEDNGGEMQICEMCEVAEIRYVHVMTHPDYAGELGAGCVCAANMEQDYTAPRERERKVRNATARRTRFLTSSRWMTAVSGKSYLTEYDYQIVVFPVDGGWSGRIMDRSTRRAWPARQRYPSEAAARMGAFHGLEYLRERQP
jgi:hypothetical protein